MFNYIVIKSVIGKYQSCLHSCWVLGYSPKCARGAYFD